MTSFQADDSSNALSGATLRYFSFYDRRKLVLTLCYDRYKMPIVAGVGCGRWIGGRSIMLKNGSPRARTRIG